MLNISLQFSSCIKSVHLIIYQNNPLNAFILHMINMSTELLSLQELCFNVIVNDFSKYSSAYFTANDESFKKNLRFLQRAYTRNLFTELDEIGKLESQHLEFLLNEHLKEVDIGSLLNLIDKDLVIEKVTAIGYSLSELSCNKNYNIKECQDIMKALIPSSSNVTKISVPCICDDDLLKLVSSHCLQLVELDIQDSSDVTGDGILALCLGETICPLKILYLLNTNVTSEDVAFLLQNMPTLEELDYFRLPEVLYSVNKRDDLKNSWDIKIKYNLTNINFSNYFENPMLETYLEYCSKLCPNLKNLTISISKTEQLKLCYDFLKLESFTVDNSKMDSSVNLNSFIKLRGEKLKHLSIQFCTFSMSILVAHCPNLESLVLKNNKLPQVNKCQTTLKYLQSVEFENIDFTDENSSDSVAMLLNSSPNLESLSLLFCYLSDSDIFTKISTFSMNCNIKHLSFASTDIGIDLLQQIILCCNSLKNLSLENCENISSDDVDSLKQQLADSKRSIDIMFTDDQTEFSFSDSDFNGDYFELDDYEDYECDHYNYYDDEDDEEDYYSNYHNYNW